MENIDTEELALRAVLQARRLTRHAEDAARRATAQAVALLHQQGLSQRAIAQLTGLSKSDVARRVKGADVREPAPTPGDDRVYAFADEWIWGNHATAKLVDVRLSTGAMTWGERPARPLTTEEREAILARLEATPARGEVRIEREREQEEACAGGICGSCKQCEARMAARSQGVSAAPAGDPH